jgi:hypothetical protein
MAAHSKGRTENREKCVVIRGKNRRQTKNCDVRNLYALPVKYFMVIKSRMAGTLKKCKISASKHEGKLGWGKDILKWFLV